MKHEKHLVIPNIEELTDEQFDELKDFLDGCPLTYNIFEKINMI